ncbi:tetratricopeptide repeat protein [bacterium]|nr:tetratricopeptide repeat protein [bacterium]
MHEQIQQQVAELREAGYQAALTSHSDSTTITINLSDFPHQDFVASQVELQCSRQYPQRAPHLNITVQQFSAHGELEHIPIPMILPHLEQWDSETTLLELIHIVEAKLNEGIHSSAAPNSHPIDPAAEQKIVMAIMLDSDEMQRAAQLKTVAIASDIPVHTTAQPDPVRAATHPVRTGLGIHPAAIPLILILLIIVVGIIWSSMEQAQQRRFVAMQATAQAQEVRFERQTATAQARQATAQARQAATAQAQQAATTLFNEAYQCNEQGDFVCAIDKYTQYLSFFPNSSGAYNPAFVYLLRGNAYAEQGKHARAIEDYDQAIALDGNFANAYYSRGNSYATLRQKPEAIANFEQYIELSNDTTWIERAKARLRELRGY